MKGASINQKRDIAVIIYIAEREANKHASKDDAGRRKPKLLPTMLDREVLGLA